MSKSLDIIIVDNLGEDFTVDLLTADLSDILNEVGSEGESFEVTDWGDVHPNYQDESLDADDMQEYIDCLSSAYVDIEIFHAGIDAGINLSDIDEAYAGSFSSDEAFAEEIAEETGAIDRNASWPLNCIDWEYAAKELMYDYSESNGHYFRNM